MSAIRFNCPSCGVPLKFPTLPPEGKKFHCPKCKVNIRVAAKKPSGEGPHAAARPAAATAAGHPPPHAPIPMQPVAVELIAEKGRGGHPALRQDTEPVQGPSDFLWKLVAGVIGLIMAGSLFAILFWNYIPK